LPQDEIEALLVDRFRAGKMVVRLKGGDPFVFGRGGEEARRLSEDGVDYEIVPGVSASLAAAACAGIPLTHRELASSVVLVTGHEDPAKTTVAVDWKALAVPNTTICIYMGMGRLTEICRELIVGGLVPETPAACVQWASLARQRTCVATLATLPEAVSRDGLAAPAMIIVGAVVGFRNTLAWFEKKPLLGRRVAVTRNRERAGELAARLEEKGAEVLRLPLLSIVPSSDPDVEEEVFEELGSYDWIVFSSANGVRCFFDLLIRKFEDLRSLGTLRIAAVGEATASAIRSFHLRVDLVPARATAEDLAEALVETGGMDNTKIVVVTGNLGRAVLIDRLNEARAIVDRFPVYRTEKTDLSDHSGAKSFREKGADAVLFTSSSAVRSFADQADALKLGSNAKRPIAGSIGPITSETMRKVGMPVDFEAKKSTLDALVDALCQKLGSR
jgi:uroporphyrinogen III methyltransferase/synthase